jgi:parallel beta-helix repeat protein
MTWSHKTQKCNKHISIHVKMIRLTRGLLFTLCLLVFLACQISDEISVSGDSTLSISVPSDYSTIQSAIDNAVSGDTVFVSAGLYYERVTVNKTLTLVGDNGGTVLDGSNMGTLIRVTADNVKITGFKLQNSGWKWGRAGVEVYNADNCVIEDNFVYLTCHQIRLVESQGSKVVSNIVSAPSNPFPQSAYGVRLENCTDCLVIDNNVSNNIGGIHFEGTVNCTATGNYIFQNSQGIRLYSPCINNKIVSNTVFNNTNDGMLVALPNNTTFLQNTFFHNNFINNSQPFIGEIAGCVWDNGHEGNYWTAYQGQDSNHDGIGDTPYVFGEEQDRYPLMGRRYEFQVSHQGKAYGVELIGNFVVLDFLYNETSDSNSTALTLNIESGTGNTLFCRATFPTELLDRPYSVEIDGSREPDTMLNELSESNSTHVLLYFTHSGSAHTILLIGTSTAEDHSPTMPYLIIAAALGTGLAIAALILWKGRRKHARERQPQV